MKEIIFAMYDATSEELVRFKNEHHNAYYSCERASLISLNNICHCFIDRVKCEKKLFYQTLKDPLRTIKYECYCESSETNASIPQKQQLQEAYIDAIKIFGEVPDSLEELYQTATSSPSRSGRDKITSKETVQRTILACVLHSIAKIEKKYDLGFFPIRTRAEARVHFYKLVIGENAVLPCDGARDLFNLSLKADNGLRDSFMVRLEALHENGFFEGKGEVERVKGTLPTSLENAAWWGYSLLQYGIWRGW